MTVTAADWVAEVEQHLGSGTSEERNKLASAITDTTGTTVSLSYDLGGIQAGATLAVDLEIMHVWAVDDTAKTATVERGQYGSAAATHTTGSIVFVNGHNTKFAIFRALNQDLLSLTSVGLYHMATVDLTYQPLTAAYNLTGVTNLEDVYMVEAKYTGSTADWREVRSWYASRDESVTDFASGFLLRLHETGQSGQLVRVHYKQAFVALTDLTTDVSTTLLPSSAYDIPPVGAAARLVLPREVGRNATWQQGDTRRAEEVPARAVAASASDLRQQWDRRVGQELNELQRRYPIRIETLR